MESILPTTGIHCCPSWHPWSPYEQSNVYEDVDSRSIPSREASHTSMILPCSNLQYAGPLHVSSSEFCSCPRETYYSKMQHLQTEGSSFDHGIDSGVFSQEAAYIVPVNDDQAQYLPTGLLQDIYVPPGRFDYHSDIRRSLFLEGECSVISPSTPFVAASPSTSVLQGLPRQIIFDKEPCGQSNRASSVYPLPMVYQGAATAEFGQSEERSTTRFEPLVSPLTTLTSPMQDLVTKVCEVATSSPKSSAQCPHCSRTLTSKTGLGRHIRISHGRTYPCTLHLYGCTAVLSSKHDWKRHVLTKHLLIDYWRCQLCCQTSTLADAKPKDFNRKDLFVQHIKRKHMPSHLKDKTEQGAAIHKIVENGHQHIRSLPIMSACGFCFANGIGIIFSGAGSWDCRMDHVAKHHESLRRKQQKEVEDKPLRGWLIEENLLAEDAHGKLVLQGLHTVAKRQKIE